MSTEATPITNEPDFGNIFDNIPSNFPGAIPIPTEKKAAPPTPPTTPPAGSTPPTTPLVETEPSGEDTLTTEQIQAKLTELEGKEEKDLTDEDKEFISQHTEDDTAVGAVKNTFKDKYGLDFEDKVYEDSPAGLASMVDDVVPIMAQAMLENHFAAVPIMAEFYKHVIQEGRGIDTFMLKNTEPEYKKLELKETTTDMDEPLSKKLVANQKELIKLNYRNRGISEEMIDQIIEMSELKGNLFSEAVKSRDALKADHAKTIEANIAAEDARKAADEQQKINTVNAVKKMIKDNDFNGRSINPAHLKNFEKALLEVDANGKSILDYKREKLTLGDIRYIDYLVLNDFKVGQYTKAPTQNVKFSFGKKAEANDARNGGRVRGTGSVAESGNGTQQFDLNSFLTGVANNKKP